MKKFFALILSAALLVTSAVTFAAPHDGYNGGCGCYQGDCWR